MTAEPTPGPWRILARGHNLAHGRGPAYDVQQVESDGLGVIICDKATLADATQIAAVPALLEACKRLEIQARHANQLQHAGVEIGPAVWSDLHESCNAARAALALAETTKGE